MSLPPHLSRPLWVAAGSVSLALGAVGVILPLLPATPFVLLSALCYAKGSRRLHDWLTSHPRFGPGIDAWRQHRAITPSAKRTALAAIALALAVSLAAGLSPAILALQALLMAGVATFILTRPSPPPD